MRIAENLRTVQSRIQECARASGRDPDEILLVAVSKTRSPEEVRQAWQAGQLHFGENTIQDAMTKIPELRSAHATWHFIGHLQSKKASRIPANFQWIHSIDSIKLARKLAAAMQRAHCEAPLNCLLQVNTSGEPAKSGLAPDAVAGFIRQWQLEELPLLDLRGLMTIGVADDSDRTRSCFHTLRDLRDACADAFSLTRFDQLSMGMSNDYAIAIEEGSTIVRVGTSIFGERESSPPRE